MKPATFERIRSSILKHLDEADEPVRAEHFAYVAGTSYERAREVRNALEAAGVIRTYRDMDTRNHPLVTVLTGKPPEAPTEGDMKESIPLQDDLVIVRTKDRTYMLPCVTGVLTLNQPAPEIQPAADPRRQVVAYADWDLLLSGVAPGYALLPNTPDPTTIKKED